MKSSRIFSVVCALLTLWTVSAGAAQASGLVPGATAVDVSASGGVIVLNENDTALPDNFVNVPITVAGTYHLSRICAVEGEFAWLLAVQREIDLDATHSADRRMPHVLTYQANVIAKLPLKNSPWSPYATAGCGALTFLSNTDADRLPRLVDSETMFAMNFGAGVTYHLAGNWLVRADFREFAAFPSDDAEGLSVDGSADPIWMERITAGVGFRF